jgi:hypothetical protein
MLVDDIARDGGWAYDLPSTMWKPVSLLRFFGFVLLVEDDRSFRNGVESSPSGRR